MRAGVVLAMALASVVAPVRGVAGGREDAERADKAVPLKEVKLLIEHNATDEDTGFQVFLDGEPWRRLMITNPDGRGLLDVRAAGQLRDLGLTEFFFETNEPPNEEVPIEDLLAQFPAGTYEFEARSIDGIKMTGAAKLTHDIPKGPVILSPSEGEVVDPNDTVIRWEPVAESIEGGPVEIVSYEVIVSKPVAVPAPGFSKPVLSVHVSGATTSLTVPKEFFEANTEYDLEVLALEVGGNQTITASSFSTQ